LFHFGLKQRHKPFFHQKLIDSFFIIDQFSGQPFQTPIQNTDSDSH
jgi:hypothetical protein